MVDTYGLGEADLDRAIVDTGVEAIVFDMQDVGVRFYTYIWTMYDVMRAAARTGVRFVVLDRPNPLGGVRVEGPGVEPGFESFVGRVDIPIRHGKTAGELARLFAARDLARDGLEVDLDVIDVEGWDRTKDFDATGLPWVPPSPNMPTLETVYAFCATAFLEGTNVSEGRGTTKPFELFGAPFTDARLTDRLRAANLPGVLFREAWFEPTFSKHAGRPIHGTQLHVLDRHAYEPVTTGIHAIGALADLYPTDFRFLQAPAGALHCHIDLLWELMGNLVGTRR